MTRAVAAAAVREQEVTETRDASLLEQTRDLQRKALGLMAKAYQANDLRTALAGVSAATKLLELQGRFLGQIAPSTINVLVTAEFRQIQVVLLDALQAHPDAKEAVLAALERIA